MAQASRIFLWEFYAPFELRRDRSKGLDVWQFFNAKGQPLGPAFPLRRKASTANLSSIQTGYRGGDVVTLCDHTTYGTKDYWRKIDALLSWQLDGERSGLFSQLKPK
ncbi:hypothetical protein AXL65_02225 [Salmonella enterica subsp. enterica]|nr:hypothetical protein [Salmonella enterica subsp. enterica]